MYHSNEPKPEPVPDWEPTPGQGEPIPDWQPTPTDEQIQADHQTCPECLNYDNTLV